jgi:hypothetical protein
VRHHPRSIRYALLQDGPKAALAEEKTTMKKLMTLMLGLSLALGCVAIAFAQDTPPKKSAKKKTKKKAPKTPKKDGGK